MAMGPAAAAWAVAPPPLLAGRGRGVRPPARRDGGTPPYPLAVPSLARRRRLAVRGGAVTASATAAAAAGGGGGRVGAAAAAAAARAGGVTLRPAAGREDVAAAVAVWAAVSGGVVGWEEEVDGAPSTVHIVAWAPDGTVRWVTVGDGGGGWGGGWRWGGGVVAVRPS